MSESVHKRSFLEVYDFEDEERTDVNILQEEFESECTDSTDNESVNCLNFGLEIGACLYKNISFNFNVILRSLIFLGDTYEDWDLAEMHIGKYATEAGFEVVKRRL